MIADDLTLWGGTQLAIDNFGLTSDTRWATTQTSGTLKACTKQGGDKKYPESPPCLLYTFSRHTSAALISRWTALLSHAAMQAFAASLLAQESSSHANVDGNEPLSASFAKTTPRHQPQPPTGPLVRSCGLDLATSRPQSLETD